MLPLQKNNSSPAGTGKTLLTGYLFYCLQVIINHPRYLSGIVGGVTEKRFTGVFLWTRVNEHFSGLFSGSFPGEPGLANPSGAGYTGNKIRFPIKPHDMTLSLFFCCFTPFILVFEGAERTAAGAPFVTGLSMYGNRCPRELGLQVGFKVIGEIMALHNGDAPGHDKVELNKDLRS